LASLSNSALLVNNLLDLALYAGNSVVSAVGMKPPHDGVRGCGLPRLCARSLVESDSADLAAKGFLANGTSRRSSAFSFLSLAIWRIYVKLVGAIVLLLGTTATAAELIPLPRARWLDIPGDQSATVSPCQSRLAEIAAFKPLPPITGPGDCTATDVIALEAVLLPDKHRVVFSPTATLRCPMAETVRIGYAKMWRRPSATSVSRCAT
jgi:hypothetical protein